LQLGSVLATSRELLQATKDIRSAFLVLWWRTIAGASRGKVISDFDFCAALLPLLLVL
jgi:hypothetical protein